MSESNPVLESHLDMLIAQSPLANGPYRGRRRRAFCHMAKCIAGPGVRYTTDHEFYPDPGILFSYNGVYDWLRYMSDDHYARHVGATLPLFETMIDHEFRNPDLSLGLQDLGDEIQIDIAEACDIYDDPSGYYPGPNRHDIEPVPDAHVNAVIAGMQRELNRELRTADGKLSWSTENPKLPPFQLAGLPFPIQRTLVERRRYRFKQFGIDYNAWARKRYSLHAIPEDAEYVPRKLFHDYGTVPLHEARRMPARLDPEVKEVFIRTNADGSEVWNRLIDGRVDMIYMNYPQDQYYD